MEGKQIRNMALVFGGLAALVLLLERPWSKEGEDAGKALYPNFSADRVDRIVVESSKDTVTLAKRGELWVIEGANLYPADTASVHRALEAVDHWTANQIVSKNPAKHSVYEVDSTGVLVKLYAGKDDPAVSLIVGKTSPEGGTYFRPVGSDEVYGSPDRIRSLFVRVERAWQDRRVFDVEPTEISRLKFEHGDSTAVLEKGTDGTWALKEPETFAVKTEEVDNLLRHVCKLVANAMPDTMPTPSQAGFDHPKRKVRAERLDGTGIDLLIGSQAWDGTYYAKAADRDWIYKVATYRVDPFFKDLHSLKAPLPTPAPPDSAAPAVHVP